ncbi:MAG TPA: hemerythrin domain-containing protein [Thermoanaerobaculia bacterium]|nr:hemerythrin domain-containing protein [Thermoanaerobaculia bacterium]
MSESKSRMVSNIGAGEAVALLEGRDTSRDLTATDWLKAPLTRLTTEIVEVFHRRTRYRLVTLISLSARVAAAHGDAHPHFIEIHDEVQRIARDLVPHMHTEERYLFPYIASLESPGGVDKAVIVPLLGSVEYPMKALQHQHSVERTAFQTMRKLTNDFAGVPGSCDGVSRLYTSLKKFDQELVNHLALEDGILFPRAVQLEKGLGRR